MPKPNRIRFTKENIAALPPASAGSRATYYDSKVPKLAVRVTAAGAKTYYVVKRAGAKMEWVSLGAHPDMTPQQAQDAAETKLGEFAAGGNPAEAKRVERKRPTLAQAYADYFDLHVVPRGVKSADEIKATWERFLGPLVDEPAKKHGRKRTKHPAGVDWSGRHLHEIGAGEIRSLHDEIGTTHSTMANRVIELLSAIFNDAIRRETFRGDNPCEKIAPFKESKRDRFIKADELPRFFEALAADTSADFKHFVLLSLLTGARRTNVLAMRWQDVDLAHATWRIPDTKNDDPLVVALVGEAVEILKERKPKPEGFVFAAPSKTGYATPPKKRWRALLARAKVNDLRVHDLRRSLGSWQAITGASLAIIGKSLGHKSPDATMIYARLSLDPVRASLNTATTAMLTAAKVKKPGTVEKMPKRKGARHV